MKISVVGIKRKWAAILLFLILASFYPYVFSQFLPIPSVKLLSVYFLLLIFSSFLIFRQRIRLFSPLFNCLFVAQILSWLFFFYYHNDASYITRVVLMSVAFLALLFMYNTDQGLLYFLRLYNKWILFMAIGGVICFFLVLLLSLTPLFEFNNVDGRTAYCFGFSCTNVYIGNIIRYSGYFDEPGAMAYWGVFALILNRLFVRDWKLEKKLIVCLIFTFSIAYYIQLCFYLMFFYITKLRHAFFLLAGLSFVFGAIYLSKDTPYDIYQYTFYRFEVNDKTGKIQGDSRSELMEMAQKQYAKAPVMGIGAENMAKMEYMADNPYETLAKDGIVGTFITYLPLLLIICLGLKKHVYLFSAVILFLGYLQRPFHVDFIHPIMLYMLTILIVEHSGFKIKSVWSQ